MKTRLRATLIDLHEKLRREVIALLTRELAHLRDLDMQAKQAHWNAKGPNFNSLHELLDRVAEQAEEAAGDIAERAVALGGKPPATLQAVAAGSRLPRYPLDAVPGTDRLRAVAGATARCAASARAAIGAAAAAGDADTGELFRATSRRMDHLLWLIETHLQAAG